MRIRALALAVALAATPAHAAFEGFDGWWGGEGAITLKSGEKETMKCRSTGKLSDNNASLALNVRCASTSYKIDVSSSFNENSGTVTGSWVINTHDITGVVKGSFKDGAITGRIETPATKIFTAKFSVEKKDKKLTVTISPEGSSDVRAMTIAMNKG